MMKKLSQFKLLATAFGIVLMTSNATVAMDPTNPMLGIPEKTTVKKEKSVAKSTKYVLKSILKTDKGKFAVINDKVIKHRGTLDGYTIVIDGLQSVLLKGEKKSQTLRLVQSNVRSR